MLNADSKRTIIECLNKKGFSEGDFFINESNKKDYSTGNYTELNITLSYNPICKMKITIFESSPNSATLVYSPGSILMLESDEKVAFRDLPIRLCSWLDFVARELQGSLQARLLEQKLVEQEKRISEAIKKIDESDDTDFTDEEKRSIREKLEQIEVDLKKELEKIADEKSEMQKDIKKMQEEIAFLRNMMDSTNKKTWLKAFVAKMFNWLSVPENRQLLSASFKIVRAALPSGVQDVIDIDSK